MTTTRDGLPLASHSATVVWTDNGLTEAEVAARTADGRINRSVESPVRPVSEILRANALTPVNAIMLVLFVLVVASGHWRDGLFVGVVLSNTVIGVVQETRARRELARLEVLTEPATVVVRAGTEQTIDRDDVVIDDLLVVAPGGQVPVDGRVVAATGLQLDESMLTGESRPVPKAPGDEVLSGSFVVAGSGRIRATAIGEDSYVSGLTTEAKTFTAAESHLGQGIDRILRWLTLIIPAASALLLLSLLDAEDRWQDAIQGTVAAAVAMVPDGLVLLTSLAFVAGVLELSRRQALAKQLSTVEVLARVDTLCLDKTGTITTGDIVYADLHPLDGHDSGYARTALAALAAADEAPNPTMAAIIDAIGTEHDWRITAVEPFSSARKWSAAEFDARGWYYLGAPDVLLDGRGHSGVIDELSAAGKRLLAIAHGSRAPEHDLAPMGLEPIAIVELEDEIRPDVDDILAYFADQDVTVKVISGDSPATVAAIARRAGLNTAGSAIDARELLDDNSGLAAAVNGHDIFGRVAPRQKRDMVHALQQQGHVVAMTGDGVNDVLALKDADLGIAMGSGSAATRSVADLVLTDDSFTTLPVVVREGRKVINNVERVANLFVTKAVYAVLLTLVIGLLGSPFPFLPRQLTLIGTFSIGIPGFFLALAPETGLVRGGFLRRVLRFSIPAGAIAGTATLAAYETARRTLELGIDESRSLATITLLGIGLAILVVASRPIRRWKLGLAAAMAASYGLILSVPFTRDYFEMRLPGGEAWTVIGVAVTLAAAGIATVPRLIERPGAHRNGGR